MQTQREFGSLQNDGMSANIQADKALHSTRRTPCTFVLGVVGLQATQQEFAPLCFLATKIKEGLFKVTYGKC